MKNIKNWKIIILIIFLIVIFVGSSIYFYFLGVSQQNKKDNGEQKLTKKCEKIVDKEFVISFVTNGGNKLTDLIVCVNSCDLITNENLPIPKKTNMEFDGWYYDENLTTKVEADNSTNVLKEEILDENNCFKQYADIILYAKWKEKKVNNQNSKPNNNNSNNTSTNKPNVKVEYYCIDPEATLNGKYCETEIEIGATENYGCESPYVLGDKDWCWLFSSTTEKITTDGSYYRCPNSYSENNDKNDGICYKFDVQHTFYVCPDKYTLIKQQIGLGKFRYLCRYTKKDPANIR